VLAPDALSRRNERFLGAQSDIVPSIGYCGGWGDWRGEIF